MPNESLHCTGSVKAVLEARKSFPSGHSSLSFSAAIFTTFFLTRRLRLMDIHTSHKSLKMIYVAFPMLIAMLVAISRVIDFHHHFGDIIAGAGLGSFVGTFVFVVRGAGLPNEGVATPINSSYSAVEVDMEPV